MTGAIQGPVAHSPTGPIKEHIQEVKKVFGNPPRQNISETVIENASPSITENVTSIHNVSEKEVKEMENKATTAAIAVITEKKEKELKISSLFKKITT